MKDLRRVVKRAEAKLNEASCAVQCIEKCLSFSHFNGETPQVVACSGNEIILEFRGHEMHIEKAIEIMEGCGNITPSDFVY